MPGDFFFWVGVFALLGLSMILLIFIFSLLIKPSGFDSAIHYDQLSILIPFKNESRLYHQLENLRRIVSGTQIKVFWVDDFSDSIPKDFLKAIEDMPSFGLIKRKLGKPGKKEAISFGMEYITGDWVLLMDADTLPHRDFFSGNYLPSKKAWKMILLPVHPAVVKGSVRSFFDIEFLTLQLVTHASARLRSPLLANGAAILVKRKEYLETLKYRDDFHIPSGDDVFALFAFQKNFGAKSIGSAAKILKPFKAEFPRSAITLWNQRLRWISKTGQVKNIWYLFISILVWIANISFVFFAINFITRNHFGLDTVSALVYLVSSTAFLFFSISLADRQRLSLFIIPAIFAYPFYLSALILASVKLKPKWK